VYVMDTVTRPVIVRVDDGVKVGETDNDVERVRVGDILDDEDAASDSTIVGEVVADVVDDGEMVIVTAFEFGPDSDMDGDGDAVAVCVDVPSAVRETVGDASIDADCVGDIVTVTAADVVTAPDKLKVAEGVWHAVED
jgi:hypothetical protein